MRSGASPNVLHVIPVLSRGGAARALLRAAAGARALGGAQEIASLRPAATSAAAHAGSLGLPLLDAPRREVLLERIAAADIVHVYFWNTPELHELLRAELPPLRLLVWVLVAGNTPPQVVTADMVERADSIVADGPETATIALFAERTLAVIPPSVDADRVVPLQPKPHASFNVGYIGTVDFVKMHPRYAAMSVAADIPDARFVVCGSGDGFRTLAAQAEALGASDRFDLRGFVEDIGPVLATLDVFGYPLCPGNYSSTDLALQEAMYAGVPPVVLPHGGARHCVVDGETGIVAAGEDEYARALEHLHADAAERARLGRNAHEHARREWQPARLAERWSALYASLLRRPKRPRRPVAAESLSGGAAFVAGLGGTAPQFATSLEAPGSNPARAAERAIAQSPDALFRLDGGILDYRRRYPDDPMLRLWAGLVLAERGHDALAVGELKAALELGCPSPCVEEHLGRAARRIGAGEAVASLA
jgi:glycosyltransferase involved in cell wall biosynthesis